MTSFKWAAIALVAAATLGCKVQISLSGTSVAADVHTISIATFYTSAKLAPPNLSQVFTEKLKDTFVRQSNLTLVKADGDLQLEGEIVGYAAGEAEAVGTDDQSQLSRLTITVKVRFTDTKNEANSYEQSFSNFLNYPGNQTLADVEAQLIEQISDNTSQDIFTKSLGNW